MYICKQGGDGTPKVKIHVEHIFNFGQNNMKYDGCGIGMKFAELVQATSDMHQLYENKKNGLIIGIFG